MLLAIPPLFVMRGLTSFSQKGYGHVYGGSNTANLPMSYTNVDWGSAPSAGDLVIWLVMATDSIDNPLVSLPSWTTALPTIDPAANFIWVKYMTKVVTSSDLSSSPDMVVTPEFGSVGFWYAYSVGGSINSLTINNPLFTYGGNAAPSSQAQNSSGAGAYTVTIAASNGTDDSPTLTMSGATPDIDFTVNNQWSSFAGHDNRIQVKLSTGGANLSFSKLDDGSINFITGCYIAVS